MSLSWLADTHRSPHQATRIRFCRPTTTHTPSRHLIVEGPPTRLGVEEAHAAAVAPCWTTWSAWRPDPTCACYMTRT